MHFDCNLHTTRANQLLVLSLLSRYLPTKQTLFTDASQLKLDALGAHAKSEEYSSLRRNPDFTFLSHLLSFLSGSAFFRVPEAQGGEVPSPHGTSSAASL